MINLLSLYKKTLRGGVALAALLCVSAITSTAHAKVCFLPAGNCDAIPESITVSACPLGTQSENCGAGYSQSSDVDGCHRCTVRDCPSGETLDNCSNGYAPVDTANYSGKNRCHKCVAAECPSGSAVNKTCGSGWTANNVMIEGTSSFAKSGDGICQKCVADSCKVGGTNVNCNSDETKVSTGFYSGSQPCYKCEKKNCTFTFADGTTSKDILVDGVTFNGFGYDTAWEDIVFDENVTKITKEEDGDDLFPEVEFLTYDKDNNEYIFHHDAAEDSWYSSSFVNQDTSAPGELHYSADECRVDNGKWLKCKRGGSSLSMPIYNSVGVYFWDNENDTENKSKFEFTSNCGKSITLNVTQCPKGKYASRGKCYQAAGSAYVEIAVAGAKKDYSSLDDYSWIFSFIASGGGPEIEYDIYPLVTGHWTEDGVFNKIDSISGPDGLNYEEVGTNHTLLIETVEDEGNTVRQIKKYAGWPEAYDLYDITDQVKGYWHPATWIKFTIKWAEHDADEYKECGSRHCYLCKKDKCTFTMENGFKFYLEQNITSAGMFFKK